MRRLVLLVVVVVGALLFASGAQSSSPGDLAIGAGNAGPCLTGPFPTCAFPARSFSLFALPTPDGGAFGLYTHRTTAGSVVVARVRCLEVDGKFAVIGGTSFTIGGVAFARTWNVWMIDAGSIGDQLSPFTFDADDEPPTKPCATTVSAAGYFTLTSGGIFVRDGTIAGP